MLNEFNKTNAADILSCIHFVTFLTWILCNALTYSQPSFFKTQICNSNMNMHWGPPASYPMGTGGSYPGGKAAGA